MKPFCSPTTVSLLAVLLAHASCAPAPAPEPRTPPPRQPQQQAASTIASTIAVGAAPLPPSPVRPAPPVVVTPMPGEPAPSLLREARLVASSCKEDKARVDARVAQMRAAVDAELERWRAEQPGCWAEYRRRWEDERAMMQSYGAGSLGLSGVGEGGGGRGAGIGLGSIGTIGHGSGTVRGGSVRTAASASKTNTQVAGVDEADIVKTDGRYVYLAANGALRIVEALRPRIVSVTKLPGVVRELFVEGDRAVVYTSSGGRTKRCTYGYDCVFAGDGTSTRISVIDLTSRAEPKVVRRIDLSGSLMASRRIANTVHTVVADGDAAQEQARFSTWPDGLETCGTPERVVRAKFAQLERDNERRLRAASPSLPTMVDDGVAVKLCGGLLRTPFEDGQAFTTVVSFDLTRDAAPATTATLQSRPGAVFASTDALYLSVAHRKPSGGGRWYSFSASAHEVSDVHKFRIGASPRETRYVGSGVVPGHVLNQFAMDEWSGYLRIATTRGRVPDPRVESAISILAEAEGGSLVRVGAIEHLAPGEDLRAVRFDDDRGYVVTFKKTDPLFVVDLYDAAQPKVLGELKIPGFSTYMHRIDRDHLLSIGFAADDHGDFAYFDGIILQLFDVTVPTEPRLMHKEKIGSRGSSSEAATNHLAFNYFPERGLLALPMTICEGGGDGVVGHNLTFSGLLVYDVSLEGGFKRLGGVDHAKRGASCDAWWSNAASVVQRSVFLDDLVYSVAMDRLKVQRLGRFGEDVADLALSP